MLRAAKANIRTHEVSCGLSEPRVTSQGGGVEMKYWEGGGCFTSVEKSRENSDSFRGFREIRSFNRCEALGMGK